jgi:hypothetical protein
VFHWPDQLQCLVTVGFLVGRTSLQFVCKLSGFIDPSKVNEAAFRRADNDRPAPRRCAEGEYRP